jgi:hypothetical protein
MFRQTATIGDVLVMHDVMRAFNFEGIASSSAEGTMLKSFYTIK